MNENNRTCECPNCGCEIEVSEQLHAEYECWNCNCVCEYTGDYVLTEV